MKNREQLAEEQKEYLNAYDEVRQELLRIPGVDEVGVGIKETSGELTEEVAFRVYVNEKVPESSLPPEQVIPETIRGFRTDVIKRRDPVNLIGFNDENDEGNYSRKVGGIFINSERHPGRGTLGCFCRLNSDNSVVFLSNHHVLFNKNAKVGIGSKVGQPQHAKSFCCTCNEIGEVVAGDEPLDCAIARLNPSVRFISKIRQIKRNDGTLELNGFISGDEAGVVLDEVWKVGARTGLTRGTISQMHPEIEITPTVAFPKVADHGDSGSVVVRQATGRVVGLLYAKDSTTGKLGLAKRIASVLGTLNITIIPTDPTGDFDVMELDEDGLELVSRLTRDSAFADVADRMRASEGGRQLLQLFITHQRECLDLVNKRRAVTVAWHRSQGPTFLAALARSAKEPAYRIPEEIEGVSRERAAARIRAAFEVHGSEALREDLQAYAGPLIEAFVHCDTVDELISSWEELMLAAPAEQLG